MKDHAPNSSFVMLRVSRSVKTKPVAKLSICEAKMMKPEYLTLISFLDSEVTFKVYWRSGLRVSLTFAV
jgi:hypothetical protein